MYNSYSEFLSLVNRRYSCRNYSSQPVTKSDLLGIIETAQLAPSACNRQPWIFVIVQSEEKRQAIINSYERDWIKTATAFIVACGKHEEAWHRGYDGKDHTDVDLSIAIEHICLAASSMGLATCWICNFNPEILCEALNIPEGVEPIAIIPIGYPAEDCNIPAKKRKPVEEIIKWESF